MVMALVFLTVMMGMSALVLDVGSWYRAHRAAQSTADASALAAAQALPDTAQATALANEYAGKNNGITPGAGGPQITFTQQGFETDTVQVTVTKPHPGFFAKVFGLDSVNVTGRATARAWNVDQVRGVIRREPRHALPRLGALADNLASFATETRAVRKAIDGAGEVADDASPALREIRDRLRRRRSKLRTTLEGFLRAGARGESGRLVRPAQHLQRHEPLGVRRHLVHVVAAIVG